jgi:Na+-translocating ferredoxin:NAD+ oxidoreductase RnfC subunit
MRSVATGTCERDLVDALLCCECGVCELFACPMMLSPRRVNIFVKKLLQEQDIRVTDQTVHELQSEQREFRRISQSRIISRLGLGGFPSELERVERLDPTEVCVPLRHGVGKTATPLVKQGDSVLAGAAIAGVGFDDVGCMVHATISGVIAAVNDDSITIRKGESQ